MVLEIMVVCDTAKLIVTDSSTNNKGMSTLLYPTKSFQNEWTKLMKEWLQRQRKRRWISHTTYPENSLGNHIQRQQSHAQQQASPDDVVFIPPS